MTRPNKSRWSVHFWLGFLDAKSQDPNTTNNMKDMWHQDDVPCYNTNVITKTLNRRFKTDGQEACPAWSLNLTPMDCFLWGYVKNSIYQQEFTTSDDQQIQTLTYGLISLHMLAHIPRSFISCKG